MDDNFEFSLVGAGTKLPFKGYVSSVDQTTVEPNILGKRSKNVYKKISGTIANRPGMKVRGVTDATQAGTIANFDWYTSLGTVRPFRVNNNRLQVEWDGLGSLVWYNLTDAYTLTSPAATLTRFIIDSWYDDNAAKDIAIMANGASVLRHWSGGIATVASGTSNTLTKADSTKTWAQEGFSSDLSDAITAVTVDAGGTNYSVNDVLTIVQTIVANRPGIGGTATVTSVDGSGAITGISVTTRGSGYGLGSGVAVIGGSGSGATLNISGITRAEQRLIINGVEYTYDGGTNTQTLTGVSPSPAGVSANSVAIQSVITDYVSFPTGFAADFLHVIGNRVHTGSYVSRLIPISSFQDYRNYVVPTPRESGDPELLTLDDTANGIASRLGVAWISGGLSDWYQITYSDLTVGTTATQQTDVGKFPGADLSAAYSQEFIDSSGDSIVFLAKDQQLRTITTAKSIPNESRYPSLSLDVATELSDENFTGGAIRTVSDERGTTVYLTAPITGRDWMYQERETINEGGNLVAEKLWQPPQIRAISRISIIDDVVYGHSAQYPMIWQLWDTDQYHDDGPTASLPYTCVLRLPYNSYGRRQGMWRFSRWLNEGYMMPGTNLYGNVYYEYQGAKGIQNITINETGNGAHFYTQQVNISLGDGSLGDDPLGDGLVIDSNNQDLLPKFRRITKLDLENVFEHALEIYSVDIDCQWEILNTGVNAARADAQPVIIQAPVI